jgi:hypothetical protein
MNDALQNDYKQVGRNCLADFLGFDAHNAAEYAELVAGIGAFAEACEDEAGEANGPREVFCVTHEEFLPWVAMNIRVNGWLPKGKAWEQGHVELATANLAWNGMMDYRRQGFRFVGQKPTEQDTSVAVNAIAKASEHFDAISDLNALSDYEHNLRVAFVSGVVEGRTAGIIASVINYVAKNEEKKAEFVDFANSQFVGELKKRMIVRNLKCVFANQGGGRPVVFVDEAGNKITAWNPGFAVVKGEVYTVKATPVKQEEYKGVKSTMMNRMEIATEKDLAPKAPRKARAKKEVVNG